MRHPEAIGHESHENPASFAYSRANSETGNFEGYEI